MGGGGTRPDLSEAEQAVMEALWDGGPGTVRQVNGRLERRGRRWAYTTVQTLLQRLAAKGWADVDATGPAHVFAPAASREELLRDKLQTLADQFCGGTPAPLLHALVQGRKFSREEIARFRRLLDEAEG
jgi:predicted transcriptional regulator